MPSDPLRLNSDPLPKPQPERAGKTQSKKKPAKRKKR